MRKNALVSSIPPFCVTLGMSTKSNDSLNDEDKIRDTPCLMTIRTGSSVTTARPDITAGLPKRELTWLYVLQMVSRETLPHLKEVLVELTLGCHPLRT
jgi:hypothetical protein